MRGLHWYVAKLWLINVSSSVPLMHVADSGTYRHYNTSSVCHIWQEVCARLNEEFGRRRSVQVCYLQARARDKRADVLAADRTPNAVADAEADALAAHVDAHEAGRGASASSLFSLPAFGNAHAFGGGGSLDANYDGDGGDDGADFVAVEAEEEGLENKPSPGPDLYEVLDVDPDCDDL